MYNIKSKMMSANNEMKINEIVKNFYETNNINPNEEIMVVPIYDVEEAELKAELKGARLLLGIKYRKELGYLKKDKLVEEAKKLGAKVLVRDNKTKIIEKIIAIKLNEENKIHKIEKKIEINSTDKKEDKNIEMTTANSNTEMMNDSDSRYVRDCCIDKEAFDKYLADSIPTKMKTKMDKYMEGNEEEPMECMRFGLTNPTDRKVLEYSVCMLVDCDGGYMPIFKTGINTSSYFAMWSCGIDRDYDDEDEIPKLTINEIAELCCEEYRNMFIKMCEQIEKKSYKIEKKIETKIEDIKEDTTNKMTEAIVKTATPQTRAERNNNVGVGATGGGSMEIKEELPLFMRDGGEVEIERRRKELETYLKLLNANPEQMIRGHTYVALNPETLNPAQVGEQQAKDIQKWFDTPLTKIEIREWLGCGKHKADGKSWNCGFMGSRWADKKINGRQVRFAFYADKDKKPDYLKHLAYSIVIDASM